MTDWERIGADQARDAAGIARVYRWVVLFELLVLVAWLLTRPYVDGPWVGLAALVLVSTGMTAGVRRAARGQH